MRAALSGRDLLAVMPTGVGQVDRLPASRAAPARADAGRVAAHRPDEGPGGRADPQGHPGRRAPLARAVPPAPRGGVERHAGGPAAPPVRRARAVRLRRLPAAARGDADRALRRRRGALRVGVGSRFPPRLPPARRRGRAVPPRATAQGRPPILAFTATATPEVREDIVELLGLANPEVFVAGFDRPNLFPDVRKVSGEIEKRALLPDLVGGRRALVYAATRKSAARAAEALRQPGRRRRGVPRRNGRARAHPGTERDSRTASLRVVCATNAFGMGIDRPDVEAVVHFEIPGSLEAYYQEIGRGGRDGRPRRRHAAVELRGRPHARVPDRPGRRRRIPAGRCADAFGGPVGAGPEARPRPAKARAHDRVCRLLRLLPRDAPRLLRRARGGAGVRLLRKLRPPPDSPSRGPPPAAQDPVRRRPRAASGGESARSWRC